MKHTGAELDAMSEVAKSAQNRCVCARACQSSLFCRTLFVLIEVRFESLFFQALMETEIRYTHLSFDRARKCVLSLRLCVRSLAADVLFPALFFVCIPYLDQDWPDRYNIATPILSYIIVILLVVLRLVSGLWKSSTPPCRYMARLWRRTCSSSTTWGSSTISFLSPTCSRSSRFVQLSPVV